MFSLTVATLVLSVESSMGAALSGRLDSRPLRSVPPKPKNLHFPESEMGPVSREAVPLYPSLEGFYMFGIEPIQGCLLDGFYEKIQDHNRDGAPVFRYSQTSPVHCGIIELSADKETWVLKLDKDDSESIIPTPEYHCKKRSLEACVQTEFKASGTSWSQVRAVTTVFRKQGTKESAQAKLRFYQVDSNGCRIESNGVAGNDCVADFGEMRYSNIDALTHVYAPLTKLSWKANMQRKTVKYGRLVAMTGGSLAGAFVSNLLGSILDTFAPGAGELLAAALRASVKGTVGAAAGAAEDQTSGVFGKYLQEKINAKWPSNAGPNPQDRFHELYSKQDGDTYRSARGLRGHAKGLAQKVESAQKFWEEDQAKYNRESENRLKDEEARMDNNVNRNGPQRTVVVETEAQDEAVAEAEKVVGKLATSKEFHDKLDTAIEKAGGDKKKFINKLNLALIFIPGMVGTAVASAVVPLFAIDCGVVSGIVTLVLGIAVRLLTIKVLYFLNYIIKRMTNGVFQNELFHEGLVSGAVGGSAMFASFSALKHHKDGIEGEFNGTVATFKETHSDLMRRFRDTAFEGLRKGLQHIDL